MKKKARKCASSSSSHVFWSSGKFKKQGMVQHVLHSKSPGEEWGQRARATVCSKEGRGSPQKRPASLCASLGSPSPALPVGVQLFLGR